MPPTPPPPHSGRPETPARQALDRLLRSSLGELLEEMFPGHAPPFARPNPDPGESSRQHVCLDPDVDPFDQRPGWDGEGDACAPYPDTVAGPHWFLEDLPPLPKDPDQAVRCLWSEVRLRVHILTAWLQSSQPAANGAPVDPSSIRGMGLLLIERLGGHIPENSALPGGVLNQRVLSAISRIFFDHPEALIVGTRAPDRLIEWRRARTEQLFTEIEALVGEIWRIREAHPAPPAPTPQAAEGEE